MGRAKEIIYNRASGALQGKYLSDEDCAFLDKVISLRSENGVITDLRTVIFNLDKDMVADIKGGANPEELERPLGLLRDYQTTGIAFMHRSKRCVLGDSVGIGKTVQIAGLVNLIGVTRTGYFRYLVLTEKNLSNQFRDEMVKFTGENVELLLGDQKSVSQYIDTYPDLEFPNTVASHSVVNSPQFQEAMESYYRKNGMYPFDCLVVDEGGMLSKETNKVYKNAKRLADKMEFVYVLNATPFESNLETFYSQINFVDSTILPTKTEFRNRYCVQRRSAYGGYRQNTGEYKNQGEFQDLVRYRYIKGTRRNFGATMEGCTSTYLVVPRSAEQKAMMSKTSMPHMLYDNPNALDSTIPFNEVTTPKAGILRDVLLGKRKIQGGWKDAQTVLVYCLYKEAQLKISNFLNANGITNRTMNGDTPMEDRLSIIDEFQHAEFRVLITNVMKGLNFGDTNHSVIYTTPGNPNHLVQFEGRSTRGFDIKDKHLLAISTDGPEDARFRGTIAKRAQASDKFAGSDYSLILALLLEKDEVETSGFDVVEDDGLTPDDDDDYMYD